MGCPLPGLNDDLIADLKIKRPDTGNYLQPGAVFYNLISLTTPININFNN